MLDPPIRNFHPSRWDPLGDGSKIHHHWFFSTHPLVGGIPTPLKNMKFSWGYYSQYMENHGKKKTCSKPPTSQIESNDDDYSTGFIWTINIESSETIIYINIYIYNLYIASIWYMHLYPHHNPHLFYKHISYHTLNLNHPHPHVLLLVISSPSNS